MKRNFLIVVGIVIALIIVMVYWSKPGEPDSEPIVGPENDMMVSPEIVPE